MRARALLYSLLSLVAVNFAVPALVPLGLVYDHRLSYEYFRDNHADLDVAIREIREEIRREGLEDYIIILGDSVAYSARTSPDQSIGAHLEATALERGRPLRVFTLAEPSMQLGDIYTVILKLHRCGVRTPRLVVNLLYGGFVTRAPFPPVVFWLERDLKRLDPEAYDRVGDHLAAARLDPLTKPPATLLARVDRFVSQAVYPEVTLLAYRDFLRSALVRLATGEDPTREINDSRPWRDKPHLATVLKEPEYQDAFSDAPFVLDQSNPQVFFLERIITATPGDQVVFFLSPVNQVLMEANVTRPGYQDNLRRLDARFAALPTVFLNLESAVPERYFADHLHLTPEGNRFLAGLLWDALAPRGEP